jgi:Fe-S cluster assembly iron-binding protein IscA
MVRLTKDALTHLVAIRGQRGLGRELAARFIKRGPGLGLSFSKAPEPGDRIVPADGITVYLAADVAERLDAGVIDVGDKNGKTALFFRKTTQQAAH